MYPRVVILTILFLRHIKSRKTIGQDDGPTRSDERVTFPVLLQWSGVTIGVPRGNRRVRKRLDYIFLRGETETKTN